MRGERQIQRLNFGARQEYNYSPSRRKQRRQRPRAPPNEPHTPIPETPPNQE